MKLIVKNVKQVPHDVEISSDAITISELKTAIETQHSLEGNNIKLLFNGVVLEDTKTVSSYAIKEGNILIMILTKGKPVVNNKPKETISQMPNMTGNSSPKFAPISIPKENLPIPMVIPPKPKAEESSSNKEQEYANEIKTLIEMGFSKEESGNAIKAAKGSVPIAIEFLYNGLPEQNLEDDYADDAYDDGGDAGQDNDNDNDNDDGNEQQQHNENADKDYPLSDEDENEAEENVSNVDMTDANIQKMSSVIKVLYSQDPSNLEGILLSVQQQAPEILEFIQEHEEEFQNMLKEPVTEEDLKNYADFQKEGNEEQLPQHAHQGNPFVNNPNVNDNVNPNANANVNTNVNVNANTNPHSNNVQLTSEEYEVIKSIKEMGNFNEMETVQAYIACEKNVEMTANYLFETKAAQYLYPIPNQQQQQQGQQQPKDAKDKDQEQNK